MTQDNNFVSPKVLARLKSGSFYWSESQNRQPGGTELLPLSSSSSWGDRARSQTCHRCHLLIQDRVRPRSTGSFRNSLIYRFLTPGSSQVIDLTRSNPKAPRNPLI